MPTVIYQHHNIYIIYAGLKKKKAWDHLSEALKTQTGKYFGKFFLNNFTIAFCFLSSSQLCETCTD